MLLVEASRSQVENYLEVQVELIFEDCRELLAILPLGHLEIA